MAKAPDQQAFEELEAALAAVIRAAGSTNSATARRIRSGLSLHAESVEAARSTTDPIKVPRTTFDPSDPKVVGRMVALALLAQPQVSLASISPAYGSGVYAIYYKGNHPLYERISGTETPIYVGKADPAKDDASNPREQGSKLTGRLLEHASTIETAEAYGKDGLAAGLHPISLSDFTCRRLVCSTNAQLVAEKHVIQMFWPLWNSETKACWGMSKHGDAATTRANKRSPWDVVHPGRQWALAATLVDSLSPDEIRKRVNETLDKTPPRTDHAALLEEILSAFRQQDGKPHVQSNTPPIGESAAGPADDEAGGQDD